MLAREDFFSILEQTLNENRRIIHATEPVVVKSVGRDCSLFINAQLNSIMSDHPSEAVMDYLKTEFNVSGNPIRRMMVKGYLYAATTFVELFSQKGIKLHCENGVDMNNILIYPCNKKIRLFDFDNGIVYSMLKRDFPSLYFNRETKFRLEHKAPFIPQILDCTSGCYSERIIKGVPLARIKDENIKARCKEEALKQLLSLTLSDNRIMAIDYLEELKELTLKQLEQKPTFKDITTVSCLFDTLLAVEPNEEISLVISHGDLQPGNVWWDMQNGQIIIIDWETVKLRSPFYDYVALYYNLRSGGAEQQVINRIKTSSYLLEYSPLCSPETIAKIVAAEELAYQTEELISFPREIGINKYNHIIETYKELRI